MAKVKPTKKQLEKYAKKLNTYIVYLQDYKAKLISPVTADADPTPPKGPKNPPPYPA